MIDFAAISKSVSATYGGPYHAATMLNWTVPIYDLGGSITAPGELQTRGCMAQVDSVTQSMRLDEGFSDGDVRILIIDLVGDVTTDMQISITAGPFVGKWHIASVTRDPFATYWECRGRADKGA